MLYNLHLTIGCKNSLSFADDNGYLVSCEKEQSIIRLMKILRKKGNSYKKISEVVTKSTRKKFPQS